MPKPSVHDNLANLVPNDELKRFLLHENILVRESVGFYLYESWSRDDDLIPLVLEGCRRFGEEMSLSALGFASRFRWSTGTLLDAVRELELSQPPHVEELLGTAPLSSIRSHEDLLRTVLSMTTWSRVERRRAFAAMSTVDLWQRLSTLTYRADEHGMTREDELALEDVKEALAHRETRQAALEKVRELDELRGFHLKLSLVELAGAMNLHELTGNLIDALGHDDDDLAAAAAQALARMAPRWAVPRIRECYRDRSWGFRLNALGALQPIKTADAERTVRALLESEDDPALRGRIYDALRFHFTEAAAELMREEIRHPSSWMLDDELKKALWVNAQILGRDDPEAAGWLFDDDDVAKDGIFFHIPVMDLGEGPLE